MDTDCTKQGNTDDTATRELNTEGVRLKRHILLGHVLFNRILRKGRETPVCPAGISDLENVARYILVPSENLAGFSQVLHVSQSTTEKEAGSSIKGFRLVKNDGTEIGF